MQNEPKPLKAFAQADAIRLPLADDAVDLVMGSPPYMDARSYGINAHDLRRRSLRVVISKGEGNGYE